MAATKGKSKKRSYGKEQNRPLKGFTLYLCENVDYDEAAEALGRHGIRYQRHRNQFPNKSGVPDEVLLPLVGKHRWILVTTDQRQKNRELERLKILQYKVRQFVFTSGNLSKDGFVCALLAARHKMRRLCSSNPGPFSASISKSGDVSLRQLRGS